MKTALTHLQRLQRVARRKHHPLLHQIHQKHRISRKTLLYVKEYGPKTHAAWTIIRESVLMLLFASILSSLGGLALERIKPFFIPLMPLIILFPTLNDMIGDYGTIVSSRFSTLLHEQQVSGISRIIRSAELRQLFAQVGIISLITTSISLLLAFLLSLLLGFPLSSGLVFKIALICLIDAAAMVSLLFGIAVLGGLYFYRRGEDPNNFLIPLTTSVADFGNMMLLAALIILIL